MVEQTTIAQCQTLSDTKLSRADKIDELFDQGEELMEKLGCQVFILVSEDGICSSYMGSDVFLSDFCSSGLKIKQQDVMRTQTNFWIAKENGYGQKVLLKSEPETVCNHTPDNHPSREDTSCITIATDIKEPSANTGNTADLERRSVCIENDERNDVALLLGNKRCDEEDDQDPNKCDDTMVSTCIADEIKDENQESKVSATMASVTLTAHNNIPDKLSARENACGITTAADVKEPSSNTGNIADIEQRSTCDEYDFGSNVSVLLSNKRCDEEDDQDPSKGDDTNGVKLCSR
ncbi:uncharacterized protein [Ptychodera flava]|uniref:uncharacterized protein isoform X3 n=1 Tax=Ptychodera flava TaxID=63121 RepID=UPI00396A0CB1